jgi:hypothetical protein
MILGMSAADYELVTNSLKYAFPDEAAGHITVSLSNRDRIQLSVPDNGIDVSATADPAGLGSRIVQLLTQQLEARSHANDSARAARPTASVTTGLIGRRLFRGAQSIEQGFERGRKARLDA